ncbi:MAG: hypothetical protein ACYCV7_11835 [Acidimicrobiales bacterium]
MTERSGGSGSSGQGEQPGRKEYKVAVVDRETGGVRSSRRPPDPSTSCSPDEPADSVTVPTAVPPGSDDDSGSGAGTQGTGALDPLLSASDRASANGGILSTRAQGRRHRLLEKKGTVALWCVAVLGVVGSLAFGHAWAAASAQLGQQSQVRAVTSDFLLALTNFDAKNIDADFNRIQSYATGTFARQSNQFFGSTIRNQLEAALASSRGQIRSQYVEAINGSTASVFSVVDQTYVNDKMKSPAADVLRIVTNLTKRGSVWKVSDVTVLTNGSSGIPAGGGGSATSNRPAGGGG